MKHQTRLITASLSALFLLVGCQSRESYRQELRNWKGQPEAQLLSAKGAPDKFYESNRTKYLTYIRTSQSNDSISCYGGNLNSSGFCTGGGTTSLYCKETFEIINGKINTVSAEGNNCY